MITDTSVSRRILRPLLVTAVAAAFVGAGAVNADAAITLTPSSLSATVSGTTVRASVTLTAGATTTIDTAKICVRDQADRNLDFAGPTNPQISSTGTLISGSGTFASGTYSYWPCAKVAGSWWNMGARKSFTVGSTSSSTGTTATGTTGTTGTATPASTSLPVGDLPGWKQVLAEDFTSPLAKGAFPGAYAAKWMSYNGFTDTSKAGDYDQSVISAHDGTLDVNLGSVGGRPKGAAPVPLVNGKWGGQVYGRYSVRMKSDAVSGYGTGFLLWPDSENWNDGEIDFPESGLDDVAKGYLHCVGNPGSNCLVVNTTARYTDWHTYTIDWTPTKLSYLIDGQVVGSTTSNIPTKPMHWVMQVATTGNSTLAKANSGNLLIDWATIYSYQP